MKDKLVKILNVVIISICFLCIVYAETTTISCIPGFKNLGSRSKDIKLHLVSNVTTQTVLLWDYIGGLNTNSPILIYQLSLHTRVNTEKSAHGT